VDLAERFVAAVSQLYAGAGVGAELLPTVLARACVQVLPVAGAGLSLTGELRLPLGSSDEAAAAAERLQTTLGEGPCLVACSKHEPQLFDQAALSSTWPVFHDEFVTKTPYRSVASFPLLTPQRRPFGALDLYSTDHTSDTFRSLMGVGTAVVGPICLLLFDTPTVNAAYDLGLAAWMDTHSVKRRNNVWRAVGMMIAHANLSSTNALDLLRAYSYGHDTTLDDTADQLTTRQLKPGTVLTAA
jgi:hypothetical protein